MGLTLVDPSVSAAKLRREYDAWCNDTTRASRGWVLLDYRQDALEIDIAFLSKITLSQGRAPAALVAAAIRLRYDNYDLWPPSLTFIDPFSREPLAPIVGAFNPTPEGLRNVLISGHPDTQQPFLCLPGIREYHTHPQHTGDGWLRHRSSRAGSIAVICERVWRLMANNVVGLAVQFQVLPGFPLSAQLSVNIAQGEANPGPPRVENLQGAAVEPKVA